MESSDDAVFREYTAVSGCKSGGTGRVNTASGIMGWWDVQSKVLWFIYQRHGLKEGARMLEAI